VHIQRAISETLVFESNINDWVNYACYYRPDDFFCSPAKQSFHPLELNVPSVILQQDVAVTRTLTNIDSATISLELKETPFTDSECSMVVTPTSVLLAAGESFSFTMLSNCEHLSGAVVWGTLIGDHTVRVPVLLPTGPVGNGFCDFRTNDAEHDYDGGDCCPSTCVSQEYECGENGYDCVDPEICDPTMLFNGVCDPEANIPDCWYDTGDCCPESCSGSECGSAGYQCIDPAYMCPHPELQGNGVCDEENNIPQCDYDSTDCCPYPSYISDGDCDEANNIPGCYYDGGDCCASTCTPTESYFCDDFNCIDPTICYPSWLADGYCDSINNKNDCEYDHGDCCEETCVDAEFECGYNGYVCLDPSVSRCPDHDDVVNQFGSVVGLPSLSCENVRQLGLCWEQSIGHLARIACPTACGVIDKDERISRLAARYYQLTDVHSCADAAQQADCGGHDLAGSYLRHLCPCTCNYAHFESN
jgi:hypothetical protein